jgi:UPF0042 nucleotide-binding protein
MPLTGSPDRGITAAPVLPTIQVEIRTIGLLHPGATEHIGNGLFYDLSNELRNPHHDPAMRYKTGLDPEVRDHVRETPGAVEWALRIFADTAAHATNAGAGGTEHPARVTVACRGGRHRSVAVAEWAAELLRAVGPHVHVDIEHLHIGLPVVQR